MAKNFLLIEYQITFDINKSLMFIGWVTEQRAITSFASIIITLTELDQVDNSWSIIAIQMILILIETHRDITNN